MRYEEITESSVAAMLDLPSNDPRLSIEIDWDGRDFRGTHCAKTDLPASVFVEFGEVEFNPDESFTVHHDISYSWEVAGRAIRALLSDPDLDDQYGVHVIVNAWSLVYSIPAVA